MLRKWFGRSASRKRCASPSQRRVYRPEIEALENRLTPAGAMTGTLINGTLTLTGDGVGNDIVINSTGVAGAFAVTSGLDATDVSAIPAPTGVKRIVIIFDSGNDQVTFNNNATPITLSGLTINGGENNNSVFATDLKVKGNLAITNLTGSDNNIFTKLTVSSTKKPGTGNVTIVNGDGGSFTAIQPSSVLNSIAKTLTITNGLGNDVVDINDTKIGGSVINNNGAGGGGLGGTFVIHNSLNALTRAVIGGSVTATFVNGDSASAELFDAVVKGNVTFNLGSGANCLAGFDSSATTLPVVVNGKVTITGSGSTPSISVGVSGNQNGLRIGRTLTINCNAQPVTLDVHNLFVTGATSII